ncbi:hypothetical protein LC605_10685 [Nostoc sp. CHAB 5836]|uniref:ParB N-terminal domain-containing protein n=1 Tax=Nostoc sp. CHAB 5836 TaxID=2780404 RepID=UPI001E4FC265|nr:ParB N-terminal domain-containing protein [Nostoc sp. CHAB 5836]MCC5615527.1 hypothetical protein [Nostoc sp. CHAB 5836]
MKLSTSLVAVKKITPSKPRSNFADDDIEQAAQLILESEGVINPIVVRRTSLQSFEVVDGDFEYYAAARAREIDIRKGEMIGVFIIESENEETLTKQVKFFRKSKDPIANNVSVSSDGIEPRFIKIESRMKDQESRSEKRTNGLEEKLNGQIENIYNQLKELENRLPKELENRLPKPIEPLEALNTWNLTKLTHKLSRINVKSQIIEKIFSEREANGKYLSFSDAVNRIKGLGDKTMLKIIDSFAEGTV